MVFGGLLVLIGISTLVWRDTDIVGLSPTVVGVAFLVLGVAGFVHGVVRKRRRKASGEPQPMGSIIDRAKALPRLLKARKQYGLPTTTLAQWGFAVVYLLSPIDVLPELLPIIGITDDAGVAAWLLTSLSATAGRYLRWESEQRDRKP